MLERTVVDHFFKRAIEAGGAARKIRYVGQRNAPDALLVIGGRVWFVEFKRPGGRARDAQLREHERLRVHGAIVRVLDTPEAVDTFFDEVAS